MFHKSGNDDPQWCMYSYIQILEVSSSQRNLEKKVNKAHTIKKLTKNWNRHFFNEEAHEKKLCISRQRTQIKHSGIPLHTYQDNYALKPQSDKCWGCGDIWDPWEFLAEMENRVANIKIVWQFFKKSNTQLPCDPASSLSLTHRKPKQILVHPMLITALFTATKRWNNPNAHQRWMTK